MVKQLGNFTKEGKNYNLGYVTALKDEELITEREFKIIVDLILWKKRR